MTIEESWKLVREIVSTVGGFSISCLTAYFLWRRLRTKLLITCSTHHQLVGAGRVDNITLVNRGDRPMTIFSIQGVEDGKVFEIEAFKPPLVIKALESLYVATSPFSGYSDFKLHGRSKPKYYAVIEDRAVRCELIDHPGVHSLKIFEGLEIVTKAVQRFNGKLYDERTKFAIVYKRDGTQHTALVLDAGMVVEDWPFGLNAFKREHVVDAATLHGVIQGIEPLAKALGRYAIYDFAAVDHAKLDWPEAKLET
jgi:hypothetical protein